jgi:hypothetical protein
MTAPEECVSVGLIFLYGGFGLHWSIRLLSRICTGAGSGHPGAAIALLPYI